MYQHSRKLSTQKRRGFTVIELLVVVTVIIGLMAILIPAIGHMKRNATKTAALSHLGNLQGSLGQYFSDFNMYPSSTTPAYPSPNTIPLGRGAVMLAQGLMGFMPSNLDGAGQPLEAQPFGFRKQTGAAMAGMGKIYGPYAAGDPKGYRRVTPGTEEFFIDPWEHEIMYFRATGNRAPTSGEIFHTGGSAPFVFEQDDCSKDTNGILKNASNSTVLASSPSNGKEFFSMINPNGDNSYQGGSILGSDSYLIISAGADGVYFSADDLILSK